MSNLKYDAIVNSGIPIHKRYEIPESMVPSDSRVEVKSFEDPVDVVIHANTLLCFPIQIDAKIHAGYFSDKQVGVEDLKKTVGRGWVEWEDTIH